MDATIHRSIRLEVRGGTVKVVSGQSSQPSLVIGPEPQVIGRHADCALVLRDKLVSGAHMEVVATERGIRVRDLGSSNGTLLDGHRVETIVLTKAETLQCGDAVLEFRPGKVERLPLAKSERFGPLIGASPLMRALFDRLHHLAPSAVSILIQGETGTGKELVAEAIHDASDRAKQPFVVIDCSSIPAQLAESTLFGHERGAFTGAVSKRVSPFIEAAGGTVFLDEIGELPPDIQPKLLRALEQRRIKAVGANRYEPVDVRILAATHRDLAQALNTGAFRSDLYFRIARAHVAVPPLRDRVEDIPALVRHVMEGMGKPDAFRRVSPKAFQRLNQHPWHGNVRELRNLVEVALAFDKGGRIDLAEHLAELPAAADAAHPGPSGVLRPYKDWRDQSDRAYYSALYDATDGNLSEMAREARINRETVRGYLRLHRIGKYGRPARS